MTARLALMLDLVFKPRNLLTTMAVLVDLEEAVRLFSLGNKTVTIPQ